MKIYPFGAPDAIDILWHRTKTLGRGDDCCDFCLKLR